MEIWKPVVGFEGRYEVSDQGRVRSIDHTVNGPKGTRFVPGKVLRPGLASNGYYTVAIGKHNTRTVHSLVAEAFLGPCPQGNEVLHTDGSRTNNAAENLRYGTRTENIEDAVKLGTWMTDARKQHLLEVGFRGRTSS